MIPRFTLVVLTLLPGCQVHAQIDKRHNHRGVYYTRKEAIYAAYVDDHTFPSLLERRDSGWYWRVFLPDACGNRKAVSWARVPGPSVDPPRILLAEALIAAELHGCLHETAAQEPIDKHGLIAWQDLRPENYGTLYLARSINSTYWVAKGLVLGDLLTQRHYDQADEYLRTVGAEREGWTVQ